MSTKIEHKVKYDSQLLILTNRIKVCRQNKDKFLLIGDLNGDLIRGKYYNDIKLKEFLVYNELCSLKNEMNKLNYSFYNSTSHSLIDHAVTDLRNKECRMEILNDMENTSDHLVIKVHVCVGKGEVSKSKEELEVKTKKVVNINWQNLESVQRYEDVVRSKLIEVKLNNAFVESDDYKRRIDEYYENLKNGFVEAHEVVIEEKYKFKGSRNSWWTKEMSNLKKELRNARGQFRINGDKESKELVKQAKKKFRKEQRRSVFIFEEKKNKNIESLFEKPSKDEFWKALEGYKRVDGNSVIINENTKVLKDSIRDLFRLDNAKITSDPEKIKLVETVNNYERERRTTFKELEKEYINNKTVEEIIKEMKNSKTRGYDGMCNYMIKAINSELI